MNEKNIDRKKEIINIYNKYKNNKNEFGLTLYTYMSVFKSQPHFITVRLFEREYELEEFLRNYNNELEFIHSNPDTTAIIVDCFFTDHKKELEKREIFNTKFIKRRYT